MNYDSWVPCTMELLEQTKPSLYEHNIPSFYEHTVPFENVDTIIEGIKPGEVDFIDHGEIVAADESKRTLGYRQVYEAPATVSAVTGRIMAAGNEEEALAVLSSWSDTVPVLIKLNRDFYKEDPENPVFSIEIQMKPNRVTQEPTLVEDALTPEAIVVIEKTLAIIEGVSDYNA